MSITTPTTKTYIVNLFDHLSKAKPHEFYLIKLSIKYKYSKGGYMNHPVFGGLSPPK